MPPAWFTMSKYAREPSSSFWPSLLDGPDCTFETPITIGAGVGGVCPRCWLAAKSHMLAIPRIASDRKTTILICLDILAYVEAPQYCDYREIDTYGRLHARLSVVFGKT